MASRPKGTKYWHGKYTGSVLKQSTNASSLVLTGIGNIYSLDIGFVGATSGNRILIHDGIDATGPVIEEIIINEASIDQFINGENVQSDFGTNKHALQYVQNHGVDTLKMMGVPDPTDPKVMEALQARIAKAMDDKLTAVTSAPVAPATPAIPTA